VVGYDAVVICHPIFWLYIFAVQSSNVHGTEDGISQFYPNGRHWLHRTLETRFPTRFRGVTGSCESVSSMPLVIHGYSHDFTNFKSPAAMGVDGNASPITMDGISLEIVPHSPSKRSTTIVSGASG